jgi:hypothetical protein
MDGGVHAGTREKFLVVDWLSVTGTAESDCVWYPDRDAWTVTVVEAACPGVLAWTFRMV